MKKYLVMVSDLVARQVIVNASNESEALKAADAGDWSLTTDIFSEEVVERNAQEVLQEYED